MATTGNYVRYVVFLRVMLHLPELLLPHIKVSTKPEEDQGAVIHGGGSRLASRIMVADPAASTEPGDVGELLNLDLLSDGGA